MIKHFSFFAKWRKKDVDFLNGLKLDKTIKEGYCGFLVSEGEGYEEIIAHFSKKDSLLKRTKPEEFSCTFATVSFSTMELEEAKYYELRATGDSKGDPQPQSSFENKMFNFECESCKNGKEQIAPFRIKQIKWKNGQVNFTLRDPDYIFFKKDFYQAILKPLGLKSKEVIFHKTGKVSEDIVQLEIPLSESKLHIANSAYDNEIPCDECKVKQYSVQTLDYFPSFEEEFDFHICRTQEEFLGGRKRIIISKNFCNLLVKHKILKFNTWELTPMKT